MDAQRSSMNGTEDEAAAIVESMDLSECFVELLGYSEDSGHPGADVDSALLFIVTELGGESLHTLLQRYADDGETLSSDELQNVQWSMISIVCGMHFLGYCHLDIKPENIVLFGMRWKLIDFDGAILAATPVPYEDCIFTPIYMAPEIAKAFSSSKGDPTETIVISRIMDVWSVGLCCLEAVFLQPILQPWAEAWLEETGNDVKLAKWLGDYSTTPILDTDMCAALDGIDKEMSSMLQAMLVKDPEKRCGIAECLLHEWFTPTRDRMWKGFEAMMADACQDSSKDEMEVTKSIKVSRACVTM